MLKIAEKEDVPVAAELAGMLWPHHSREELEGELLSFIESGGMVFLWMEEGNPVAFAQCGIRTDYVEGTHGGAIGYLEGIFVLEKFRRRGIGRVLLAACEEWAQAQGLRNLPATRSWIMPKDCPFTQSLFHEILYLCE